MSKILSQTEAQEITKKICESYGFKPCELRYDGTEPSPFRAQICNVKETTITVGLLWWKREEVVKTYDILASAYSWEDAIEKLENLLQGPTGQGRVEKADRLRQSYATLLLDEKLENKDA